MSARPSLTQHALGLALVLALSACSSAPKKSAPPAEAPTPAPREPVADAGPKRSPYAPAEEDPTKRGDYVAGGLYAPGVPDSIPDEIVDVDAIPEPEVKDEPRSRAGNRSYSVLGKSYRVRDSAHGYVEEGQASYYGKKFHGRKTSNQEIYDMYAFTAAHRSLPLPSYVRVTNLANGKSVVVRVNDRGPFHSSRIIDLSFAAATRLGFVKQGVARVEVRALTPSEENGNRGDREVGQRTPAQDKPVPEAVQDHSVSADDFERWMQSQGIRFASGASGVSAPVTEALPSGAPPGAPSGAPSVQTPLAASANDDVLLQLASFSARDNAERARDRLAGGGVERLRIDEAQVDGRPVWRLRVGPVPMAQMQELSSRIADLGFESVQIVRE